MHRHIPDSDNDAYLSAMNGNRKNIIQNKTEKWKRTSSLSTVASTHDVTALENSVSSRASRVLFGWATEKIKTTTTPLPLVTPTIQTNDGQIG